MDKSEVEEKIRTILNDIGDGMPIDSDKDIVATGIINSASLLSVILSLESIFSIKIEIDKLVIDDLRSISSLSDLVLDIINGRKL